MPVIVSMLRGVNVGGHHLVKMDTLRALYESIGLHDARTYVQSGNVVFRTQQRDVARLPKRIEDAIEQAFGFRPSVIVRTASELRAVIAANPFAERNDVLPARLLVTFLASDPSPEARQKILQIKTEPEELRIEGRELYVCYRDGVGRSKLSPALVERTLKVFGTGRNWNTVVKLLEMAEKLEALEP
jgi:uncharacterized protein (DUF1697 family)